MMLFIAMMLTVQQPEVIVLGQEALPAKQAPFAKSPSPDYYHLAKLPPSIPTLLHDKLVAQLPMQPTPKQEGTVPTIKLPIPKKIDPAKAVDELPQPKEAPLHKADAELSDNIALALAVKDLESFQPSERIFKRYIWITTNDPEDAQHTALAVNYVSRNSVPVKPLPIAIPDKGILILRVDLRELAPRVDELKGYTDTFDLLQFDPRFNLLITEDTLKFALGLGVDVKSEVAKQKPKPQPIQKDKQGDVIVQPKLDNTVKLIRVVSEHLDKGLVAALVQGTGSQAPIVTHSYFITRVLSQIQDKGIYQIIYGGLYYQLAGIKKGFADGTDEDNLFESLGIGSVKGKVTAQQLFDKLRSDQRVAVFRSGVTGRPRRVDVFKSLVGRDSYGLVSVTHDIKQQSIDIGQHPILNLIDFKDDAREVIFEKPNGLHGFALFDGKGALQDEVPFDVALDNTIPYPHGGRLQPAIGCIRCHAKEGGWQPLHNDVKKLLSGYVNTFGDLIDNDRKVPGDVERLAGLYGGDLELKLLPRARADYAGEVLRTIGPNKRSKDQTDIVRLSGEKIGDIYNCYNYDLVGAINVLVDLGVKVTEGSDASTTLKKLLPPIGVVVGDVIPEDAIIAALLQGLNVNRIDYDLRFSYIATRVSLGVRK